MLVQITPPRASAGEFLDEKGRATFEYLSDTHDFITTSNKISKGDIERKKTCSLLGDFTPPPAKATHRGVFHQVWIKFLLKNSRK